MIDRTKQPNGAIYFVAMSTDANSVYHQRLHALDLATGAELFGGPTEIQAKYPGTGDNSQNGFVVFDPKQYAERAGLLEARRQHLSYVHVAVRSAALYRLGDAVQRRPPCSSFPSWMSRRTETKARFGSQAPAPPPTMTAISTSSMPMAPSTLRSIAADSPSTETTGMRC